MLFCLEWEGETFCEPEDGSYVRDVPHDVDGAAGSLVFEAVVFDEFADVDAEEFRNVSLESFFYEYLM